MLRFALVGALALLLTACDADGEDASPTSRGGTPDLIETRFAGVEPTGWHSAATIPTARAEVAAAVIDRKIYVVGGFTENGQNSDVVEVYDVDSDAWSSIEPMPERLDHAMAAAANGKLYVIGGWRVFGEQASDAVHEYDPGAGEWRTVASMPFPRAAGAAASDGSTIYVVGGVGPEPEVALAYDVAADEWRRISSIAAPREHLAAAFAHGKLYAIGGRWSDRGNVATVEEYDPETDSWRERAPMPTARGGLAAADLGGWIHVVGGESFGEGSRTFAEHEVYIPAVEVGGEEVEDEWKGETSLPTSRHGLAAAVDGDGWFYVIAGGQRPGLSVSGIVERYRPTYLPLNDATPASN
jgi:N-acetylneuraminic acid mutarotase